MMPMIPPRHLRRDLLLNVTLTDLAQLGSAGHICELQLVLRSFHEIR